MRLADHLPKSEYASWKCGDTVVITSPTGSGKTHFIVNELLPYAQEQNRKIIYLCNRTLVCEQTALAVQQNGVNLHQKHGYWNSEFLFISTYQKIENLGQFPPLEEGNFDERSQQTEADAAYYYVLDEAHYFVEDALFNANTGSVLSMIEHRLQHRVCIYMTATDNNLPQVLSSTQTYKQFLTLKKEYKDKQDNCCQKLREYESFQEYDTYRGIVRYSEKEIQECKEICETPYYAHVLPPLLSITYPKDDKWKVYQLPPDSSAYKTYYYKQYEELFERIKHTPGDRWLIFCLNRQTGHELTANINQFLKDNHAAVSINAQSAKANKKSLSRMVYEQIKTESRFPCRVLIATNVLDNGINLRDDSLKHIVITTPDKSLFLQMLGRKRLNSGESVNLYIGHIPSKTIQAVQRTSNQHIEFFEKFDKLNDYEWDKSHMDDFELKPRVLHPEKQIHRILRHFNQYPSLLVNSKLNYQSFSKREHNKRLRDFNVNNLAFLKVLSNLALSVEIDHRKSAGELYPLLQLQLSWLNKEYHEQNWLDYSARKRASDEIYKQLLLDATTKRKIGPDEQRQYIVEKFQLLCESLTPPQQYLKDKSRYGNGHAPSMCKLNNALKTANINFKLKSKQTMKDGVRRRIYFVDQLECR